MKVWPDAEFGYLMFCITGHALLAGWWGVQFFLFSCSTRAVFLFFLLFFIFYLNTHQNQRSVRIAVEISRHLTERTPFP